MMNQEIRSQTEEQGRQKNGDGLFEETKQFEELMMMYDCAIRQVQTKLEILDEEFSVRYRRNPISSIESRVKTPMSIYRKLKKRGQEISVKSIVRNLNDVAGVRVICNFIDDIYDIARMLGRQDDLKVDCRDSGLLFTDDPVPARGDSDPDDCDEFLGEP